MFVPWNRAKWKHSVADFDDLYVKQRVFILGDIFLRVTVRPLFYSCVIAPKPPILGMGIEIFSLNVEANNLKTADLGHPLRIYTNTIQLQVECWCLM
jgi:hypothetical protein